MPNSNNLYKKLLLILSILVILTSTLAVISNLNGRASNTNNLDSYIKKCDPSKKVDPYTIDQNVEKCIFDFIIAENMSINKNVTLINALTKTPYAGYCHFLNHKLAKYYLANGSNYQTLLEGTVNSCSDGFAHGVFESIVDILPVNNSESIAILYNICAKKDSELEQTSCEHGIGHYLYQNYLNNKINEKDLYMKCNVAGITPLSIYTCGTGISMSLMLKNFDQGEENFNNCERGETISQVSCYLFPQIPIEPNIINKKSKSYCAIIKNENYQILCEIGIINKFVQITPAKNSLQYCLNTSTQTKHCLHHLVAQLPNTRGSSEHQEALDKLKNLKIEYPAVTREEYESGSDQMLNATLKLIPLYNDKPNK